MATYKKTSGINVKTFDSDLPSSYPSAFEGQLYYNSSDGQFKYIGLGAGAWASGGNINTGRAYGGAAGSDTEAAMYFGGYTPPTNYANAEQYNGTSWTEVGDLNQTRNAVTGFGILTAAVAVGGDSFPPSPATKYSLVEEWDGSSWTEVTNVPTATGYADSAGTLTAGLFIGGGTPGSPGDKCAETFEYDGTNWTAGGDMNEERQYARVSCGTQTAALIAGGTPPFMNQTETYNGSAWTETADLNTPGGQGSGGGTSTSAVTSGNQAPQKSFTESWDGTSWTEVADRATDNYALGGVGSSNANAITFAGYDSSPASFPQATEEWTYSHAFKKVTTS